MERKSLQERRSLGLKSAFFFFVEAERARNFGVLGSPIVLSKRWSKLSAEEKKVFKDLEQEENHNSKLEIKKAPPAPEPPTVNAPVPRPKIPKSSSSTI